MILRRLFSRVSAGVFASAFCISGLFANEMDTAYVPFIVNTDATVKAVKNSVADLVPLVVIQFQIDVEANIADTLKIPLEKTLSVTQRPQNGLNNAPLITSNRRGNVSLSLPGQIYKTAEISLYSVNGKRILRAKADASQAAKNISRPSLASGAYLLSVKSASGQSFSSRLTHRGGSLNINVAFGGNENFLTGSPAAIAKAASELDGYTITVSAEGYIDSTYQFSPVKGVNPLQNITLNPYPDPPLSSDSVKFNPDIDYGSFIDTRGGINRLYRTVKIGNLTWFAENLNYAGENGDIGACYDCNKYGRLYSWASAMNIDLEYNELLWDESDENHQGVCPAGWRIPNNSDWTALIEYAGGESTAGTKLKSKTGWANAGQGIITGTNDFGFSALPGGSCNSGSSCRNPTSIGVWWSATENEYNWNGRAENAWELYMGSNLSEANLYDMGIKMYSAYVRCVSSSTPAQ
jgi:uncharacterized protein (TIGR02145 family)